MKSVLTCIFAISSVSSLMAVREEYVSERRPSVFESREKAWQGLRETEKRQEAARLANTTKQNNTQVKQQQNERNINRDI